MRGEIQAGALDREIRIERDSGTGTDAFGEPTEDWQTLATVRAEKTDISDGERWAAMQVGAEVTTRFRIRWSPDVADLGGKDRLVLGTTVYRITGTKEIGRAVGIEITAIRSAN